MTDLLRHCESQQPWLLDTIEILVRAESPSHDKAALDRCGRILADRLRERGGRVERLSRAGAGDLVRAEFGDGAGQVLLLGHFDTVWPVGQLDRMPLRREGHRLHGPGVFDMKAGIAIGILAADAARQAGLLSTRRVAMLWTTDEEIGSRASREAIEHEARQSDAVLVLEPALPGGAVKTSRKGCGEFELTVRGVAAHAGIDPGKGASAIHELARQIRSLEDLQDLPRGISVNVGTMQGGTRTNVIAEEARAGIDVRVPTMEDAARIEAGVRGLRPQIPGTSLTVTGGVGRPPFERSEGVVALYRIAREVAAELGRTLEEGSTGGGSDGNFTGAIGVPTLDGLGAVGDGAHALHEHVLVPDLCWRAALVAGLLARVPRRR
jgi:glutamate carboxypeptidase